MAVAALCRVDRGAPVRLAGDVQVHVGGLATSGPDGCLDLPPRFVEDVAQNHFGSLTAKQLCLSGALSPCTTANQCDFAIEPAHSTSPLYSMASTSRVSPALLAMISTPLRRASPTNVVASPGYPRTPQRARLPC